MKHRFFVLTLTLLLMGTGSVLAQFTQDPADAGAADTLDLVFSVVPDYTTNQLHLRADLYAFTDANTYFGVTMGFTWDNPNLQMDSATSPQAMADAFDLGLFYYENSSIATTNANQRFIFGGLAAFSDGLLPASERRLWASYFFTLSNWGECDSIVIDSLTFAPGTEMLLVDDVNNEIEPYYTGRERYKDTACAAPSNLTLTPDSLYFEGIQGGSAPPGQQFVVGSDNESLAFTLTEAASWFALSPTMGNTPRAITVLPNTIGLSAGTYTDQIVVNSPSAANSPQYVKIVLVVEEPPPVIEATPSEFFFNAVAGGANPDPKTLTIKNAGGQVLNWTVSHSSSWLSLTPSAGVDSGDVSVSVDITGLAYETYYDTIVVSDPLANNDPIKVPVTLSVGSDLPIIAVDSAFNFVVVPVASREVGPWTIVIRNDGAGAMNYWLEENSTRLFELNPSSGSAPDSVEVSFKLTTGSAGDDFFDTLWVYSNEAINSPFPVVFQFHLTDDPALMTVSTDTLRLTLYECEMGARNFPPSWSFIVDNAGGDDPMEFALSWESELFTVSTFSNIAPTNVTVQSKYLNLPIGVYLDTIVVSAQKSTNRADTVIVKYSVIAGTEQPKIWVSNYSLVVPAQENQGPVPDIGMSIRNEYGGCMPWYIVENVPWLFPADTSGINPASLSFGVNPDGFLFGEYPDSIKLYAPTASNSPGTIRVRLKVWRFHGDVDYNAVINISDLTYLISFLFRYGPQPQPIQLVGDVNCDHLVNIADLTYFIEYLFREGPIPCRNPYKRNP